MKKSIAKVVSLLIILAMGIGLVPAKNTLAEESIDTIAPDVNESMLANEDIEILEDTDKSLIVSMEVDSEDYDETAVTEEESEESYSNLGEGEEVDSVVAEVDKDLSQLTISTVVDGEKEKTYEVDVKEAYDDVFVADFTDTETNETISVNNEELQASFAFLVPIGVVIGESLAAHLIAASAAVVIAGATYYAATKVTSKLKRKDPKYYLAKLVKGKLYIGNSVTLSTAAKNLRAGGDTWSRSSGYAWSVANSAGKYSPTKAEKHGTGSNYFSHYHARDKSNKRVGGHSFY
ncbi:SAR2788 family putative toxin [Priestia filamentosa]|uniref:SAR2788 family putative toxin n=1 Tax=Priestia filamentosa TaxID=1402861 RepID=UPI00397AC33D